MPEGAPFLFASLAKGRPKRDFGSFSRELLLFLGGGCTLNDVFCGFKTQRVKRVNNLPPLRVLPLNQDGEL